MNFPARKKNPFFIVMKETYFAIHWILYWLSFLRGQLINAGWLLAKPRFFQKTWDALKSDSFLFLRFVGYDFVSVHRNSKRTRNLSSHLDRTLGP